MKIADLFTIFLLVLSLFIALAVLFRAWRYRPRPVVTTFLWLMAAIAWWLLSAIIENMSSNLFLSIFWMKMCYLGITTLPVIWLVFTLQYSDRGKWLTRPGLVLLFFILPAVTLIMVWTNDIHHLMWKNIVVDTNLYPMVKTVTYNAWFWVHATYSYVLLIAGTINLFGLFFRTSGIFRKQTGILLLASFTPWVANLLFITGIGPSFSIDPTPIAFVVTGAAILWGLSRTQLLHMMPIAYEAIFRSMTDGVIIIDQQNFIVETNSAAQRILKLNKSEMIGKTLNQVIPGHEYSLEPKTDMAVTELTISLEQDQMERFYNLYVSPIVAGQRFSGLIVLLHDDTERRKAENESREKAVLETELNERKKMEKALRESEEKFSAAFRSSPEMIIIVNMRDNKYVEVNDSFVNITGYTREELIGHTGEEFNLWINDKEQHKMTQILQEQGKMSNEEFSFRMKSGEIRNWLCSADIITIGGEACMIAVAIDITERKRAEEALRQSEEKYRTLFESAAQGIIIGEIETKKFKYANPAICTMLGYSQEELTKMDVGDIHPKASLEHAFAEFDALSRGGKTLAAAIPCLKKDGTIAYADINSAKAIIDGRECNIGFFTDITERKQAEKALRESEEKFSKIFHASPNIMVILSLKDRRIIDVNENYTRSTGYSREELIGHSPAEFNNWVNKDNHERILRILEEEGRVRDEEVYFYRRSGEIYPALLSIELINIGGEPCMLTESIDITRLKQTEEELKQAMANLEQSSAALATTNKELETFSYSVSHDLRAPLRSIDGFSQALLEDYRDRLDEHGQEYLNRLRGASQKMGELIDGLLKLSRLTRSEMHQEKVDLSALVEEIATRLQETQPDRRAKFIIGNGLTANGDPQMLRVLLENLLNNAWKFTSKIPRAEIEFGISHNGDKKTFFVKDNGAGFDMTYANKLFGAFQRLHDTAEFPGTGIGLATVQRIINRHSGNIRAEGAVGKGATFYFTLE
jgi:PAS domain S-box-containing protein